MLLVVIGKEGLTNRGETSDAIIHANGRTHRSGANWKRKNRVLYQQKSTLGLEYSRTPLGMHCYWKEPNESYDIQIAYYQDGQL